MVHVWISHYETVVHYFSVAIQFLPRVLFDHNIGYVGLSFAMRLLLRVLFDHSFGYVSLSFAITPVKRRLILADCAYFLGFKVGCTIRHTVTGKASTKRCMVQS